MELSFTKMTGAGNDFVMVDNRDLRYSDVLSKQAIAHVCDRHFGVGGDGLIAIEPSSDPERAHFRMRYYNADGGEADMCGNGARCFARFTASVAPVADEIQFETPAGVIGAEFLGEEVRLGMSQPHSPQWNLELEVDGHLQTVHSLNTGVPHAIIFVRERAVIDIRRVGSALRYHPHFAPRGTNANFVEVLAPGEVAIRTYERGVEDETLACGTGVVAAALIHAHIHGTSSPVRVLTQGGAWRFV
jgi:diaminopimelate epimerase